MKRTRPRNGRNFTLKSRYCKNILGICALDVLVCRDGNNWYERWGYLKLFTKNPLEKVPLIPHK